MKRRRLENAVIAVLVILLLVLVVGLLTGPPAPLAHVDSGTMAPTIEQGDGFIALPPAIAGAVEPGDVVVYEAEAADEPGTLRTHRVVEATPSGYVTQGDANDYTDQERGEPPVTEDRIRAVAFQPGGQVLTIPLLGSVAQAGHGLVGAADAAIAGLFGQESVGAMGGILLVVLVGVGVGALAGIRRGNRRVWARNEKRDRED